MSSTSRNSPFLHKPPLTWTDDCSSLNDIRLYLVSTLGPTVFILKTDDHLSDTTYKVIIGIQQMCSCGGGIGRGKLCIHILFIILKVLRVPSSNPLSWQLSLIDSELDQILSGDLKCQLKDNKRFSSSNQEDGSIDVTKHSYLKKGQGHIMSNKKLSISKEDRNDYSHLDMNDNSTKVKQKSLEDDIVCSICQEEMSELDEQEGNICFCSSRCGSNFHKKCFRMFVTYNRSEKKDILCPMCRTIWVNVHESINLPSSNTTYKKLVQSKCKIICQGCGIRITSSTYRCASCNGSKCYDICKRCFEGKAYTLSHGQCVFMKANITQKPFNWEVALLHPTSGIPNHLQELQRREFDDSDYNLLLNLDHSASPQLHHHLIKALKVGDTQCNISEENCVICTTSLSNDKFFRKLNCTRKHKSSCFAHESCALRLLIEAQSNNENKAAGASCPRCEEYVFPSLMKEYHRKLPDRDDNRNCRKNPVCIENQQKKPSESKFSVFKECVVGRSNFTPQPNNIILTSKQQTNIVKQRRSTHMKDKTIDIQLLSNKTRSLNTHSKYSSIGNSSDTENNELIICGKRK